MMNKKSLKEEQDRYEAAAAVQLTAKVPVFIRIEGKSFGSFTQHLQKPYDPVVTRTMQQTAKQLCAEANGCVFAYTASNVITLILTDYHKWNSIPWLDYDAMRMCSAAASIATIAFNKAFADNIEWFAQNYQGSDKDDLYAAYRDAIQYGARFEAICYNVPEDRVCAMIFHQQYQWRRNSILALANHHFTRCEVLGKTLDELHDMLAEKHISWYDLPTEYRHGSCCTKGIKPFGRKKKWRIDSEMPLLADGAEVYLQQIMDSVREDDYSEE